MSYKNNSTVTDPGKLIIIGGAEDKKNECTILKKVAQLTNKEGGRLVLVSTATESPEEVGNQYKEVFSKLGVKEISNLQLSNRELAQREDALEVIKSAAAIFFTGGDQLRITSILGGTPIDKAIQNAYQKGVIIAGTSAGASVMSSTMIVEGDSDEAAKQNTVKMAPGLRLLDDVVIDQHFAQRGRIGRLLTAIAQNPYVLGIGIDEDTAIVVEDKRFFRVIGSQTVTVLDGSQIGSTNASEAAPNQPLALTNVILHILPPGYGFNLEKRIAISPEEEER